MKRSLIVIIACITIGAALGTFLWKRQITELSAGGKQGLEATQSHGSERQISLTLPLAIIKRANAAQQLAKISNHPIKFYIKVVDQTGMAVPDATLSATVSYYAQGLFVKDADRVQKEKIQLSSDSAGHFDIKGDRGISLRIETLEKDQYLWQHPGFGSFSVGADAPTRIPAYDSPNQRLLLHLWRKGATQPFIRQGIGIQSRELKDVLAVNLFSGQKVGSNEFADLVVRIPLVTDTNGAARGNRLFTFEMNQGGIMETPDVYPYAAPRDGYQPKWEWVYQPGIYGPGFENWKRNFYVKLRNGRAYAGITITFGLAGLFFEIDAIVNPAGSPILEPEPEKQIIDPEEIRKWDEALR